MNSELCMYFFWYCFIDLKQGNLSTSKIYTVNLHFETLGYLAILVATLKCIQQFQNRQVNIWLLSSQECRSGDPMLSRHAGARVRYSERGNAFVLWAYYRRMERILVKVPHNLYILKAKLEASYTDKKISFSSYIRKFRIEQLQNHI